MAEALFGVLLITIPVVLVVGIIAYILYGKNAT